MERQTTQLVFLLDTRPTESDVETRHRSLCLACTRLLLFLSAFPNKARHVAVKWSYHFFNTRGPSKRLKAKNTQFLEQRLDCMERMFQELHSELMNASLGIQPAVSSLYSALIDVVQGFMWDSPDVLSPLRVMRRRGDRGGGNLKGCTDQGLQNLLFICSPWPEPKEDGLAGKLFPNDLLILLKKHKICVHWLYEGDASTSNKALTAISEATTATGGNVIFLSSLLVPSSLGSQVNRECGMCTHSALPLVKENISEQDEATSASTMFASDPTSSLATESVAAQPIPGTADVNGGLHVKQPSWLCNVLVTSPLPFLAFLQQSVWSGSRSCQRQQMHKLLWLYTPERFPVCILQARPSCNHKLKKKGMYMNCTSCFGGYGDEVGGGGGGDGGGGGSGDGAGDGGGGGDGAGAGIGGSGDGGGGEAAAAAAAGSRDEDDSNGGGAGGNCFRSGTNLPTTCAVVLGVLQQSDLPVSWIQPASACTCVGLVPPTPPSYSPTHPKLVLTDTVSMSASHSSLSPQGCAMEFNAQYSRDYQNLCLWLAKERMLLLLGITCSPGHTKLGVLQPLTSLLSSISLLRPHFWEKVSAHLMRQPLDVPLHGDKQYQHVHVASRKKTAGRNCPAVTTLMSLNPTFPEVEETHSDNNIAKSRITRPDLCSSLHLFFFNKANGGHNSSLQSSLKSYQSPFTTQSLLPWYPFLQFHGVSRKTLNDLTDLQQNAKEGMVRAQIPARMLSVLKILPLAQEEYKVVVAPPGDVSKQQEDGEDHLLNSETTAVAREAAEMFRTSYNEQICGCSEGQSLHLWVVNTLANLREKVKTLEKDDLWLWIQDTLLVDIRELEEKYKMQEGHEQTGREEITEYQLQVLLRLEAYQLCLNESSSTRLASEVTALLRKVSLLAKPIFLGRYMQEVIIPNYSNNCRAVLLDVCDSLMLPVPPDLRNSPATPAISPTKSPAHSTNGSEYGCLHSLQEVSTASCHSLVRRTSFQGQRQISVFSRRGKGKERQKVPVSQNNTLEFPLKRLKAIPEETSHQEPKKVRRSLFTRSHSVTSDIGCKRLREEGDKGGRSKRSREMERYRTLDFVVKETPVKKQVEHYRRFKLQRLRSKKEAGHSAEVVAIEESPQRSFYTTSSKMVFRTPKGPRVTRKELNLPKKEEPSPSAIHSLLQGHITHTERNLDQSPQLFNPHSLQQPLRLRTVHALSYESEDPLTRDGKCEQPVTPCRIRTSENLNSPSNCVEARPVCLLTDPDPCISGDSASMVAFALSTPDKDDPMDFHEALADQKIIK